MYFGMSTYDSGPPQRRRRGAGNGQRSRRDRAEREAPRGFSGPFQAASATWHQQRGTRSESAVSFFACREWSKKEETHEDEPEALLRKGKKSVGQVWGEHMYKSREEVKAEKELWAPDLEWECRGSRHVMEALESQTLSESESTRRPWSVISRD